MQSLKHAGSVAHAGAKGYAQGVQHGNAVMGVARGAASIANNLPNLQPDLPGPRTAAFYAHRYGLRRVPGNSGTSRQIELIRARYGSSSEQEAARDHTTLLGHVRQNSRAVEGLRNNSAPRGSYHNADHGSLPDLRTMAHITAYASTPQHARRAAALARQAR